MFRDRRVVTGTLIMPIFMIMLFVMLIGTVSEKVNKPQKQAFAVVSGKQDQVLMQGINALASKTIETPSVDTGIKLLNEGDVKLIILIEESMSALAENKQARIKVIYDSNDPMSQIALSQVRELVNQINKKAVKTTFETQGLPSVAAEPVSIEAKEVLKAKGLGGSALVGLLPYLIVIWAFYGGFSIVSDLVAGEKERGTMETLLVSPLGRTQAAMGKYFALAIICFLSCLTTLVAIVAIGILKIGNTSQLFPTGFSMNLATVLALLLSIIPLVLFFAGVLISVSASAKNMREAQTYLTLVSFLVIMPAVFSQFLGFTGLQNSFWVKIVPVLGNAVNLKEALLGKTNWMGLMGNLGICCALAAIGIWYSCVLFNREKILSRT